MLFYFTATGNSLFAARCLDKHPISIPQVLKQDNFYFKEETIGIVAPIYAGELPKTVQKFIEKATFETDYFYMILTYGKDDSVAGIWSEEFCKKHNQRVDFIQTIKMVDNYLPSFDMEEEMLIDKHVDKQIQEAIKNIEERIHYIPQPTKQGQKLYETVQKRFQEHPRLNNGESIIMTDRCVGCSICMQACPCGNIIMEDDRAKRISKTCDFCLACAQNCPFHAIDVQNEKNSNARYRHPQITLKDIVKSNQQGE